MLNLECTHACLRTTDTIDWVGYLQPLAVDLIFLHGREALDEHLCHAMASIRDHRLLNVLPYSPTLPKWLGGMEAMRASVI
jgi:hypothetical protein